MKINDSIKFITSFFVTIALLQLVANAYFLPYALNLSGGDEEIIADQILKFNDRDLSKKSIIFLGGSDVREAIDLNMMREINSNIQVFSFAHSSGGNSLEEQHQMISALGLGNNDLIYVNINPIDFLKEKNSGISEYWETNVNKLERESGYSKTKSQLASEKFFISLEDFIPYYKFRTYVRNLFSSSSFKISPISLDLVRYKYGNESKDKEYFEKYLGEYQGNKIGNNYDNEFILKKSLLIKSLQNDYSQNIHFIEIPRNPLYKEITDNKYLDRYQLIKNELEVLSFSNYEYKFYDFDHLTSDGRIKFTSTLIQALKIEAL